MWTTNQLSKLDRKLLRMRGALSTNERLSWVSEKLYFGSC